MRACGSFDETKPVHTTPNSEPATGSPVSSGDLLQGKGFRIEGNTALTVYFHVLRFRVEALVFRVSGFSFRI